jgi:chromosome partitioning protein
MPTIVFANPKGGAGKSTSAVLLATQIAESGASVSLLDADPNKPLSFWSKRGKKPEKITVIADISETSVIDEIDTAAAKTPFVIVDLEGTASMMVAYAISRADLVIIPVQGSQLDAQEAAKAIKLIRQQEKAFSKKIPLAIVLTRTNPAVRARTLSHIQGEFTKYGIRLFQTEIHEREAYRALFSFGGSLQSLDPSQVGGLEKAIINAKEFVAEVVEILKANRAEAEAQVKTAEVVNG